MRAVLGVVFKLLLMLLFIFFLNTDYRNTLIENTATHTETTAINRETTAIRRETSAINRETTDKNGTFISDMTGTTCPPYWKKHPSPYCCRGHKVISLDQHTSSLDHKTIDYRASGSKENNTTGSYNKSTSDCIRMHFDEGLPQTALASFPGSGNTWTRYLIQQTTGIYTGSIYNNPGLRESGLFPGERYQHNVIVVKTHQFDAKYVNKYKRVILLVRNPFDAILAEYNRQRTNQTGSTSKLAFTSTLWMKHVIMKSTEWLSFHKVWLTFNKHSCIHVLQYKRLREDPVGEMQKLARVLGVASPLSPSHLACLEQQFIGNFTYKRKKPVWMEPSIQLYTEQQQNTLRTYVKQVNTYLKKYNVSVEV